MLMKMSLVQKHTYNTMIVGPDSFDPYSETGPSDPSSQVHRGNINQSYRISNTDNSTIRDTDPKYNYQESV